MNLIERRMDVYKRLQKDGVVNIKELAQELDVSSMTIRRDLQYFAQQSLVTIRNGNAYLEDGLTNNALRVSLVNEDNADLKHHIGRAAAELVEDGDTIILDCGTTTLQLLRYLGNKQVTVFTNSIPVGGLAGDMANIRIVYAPGEYDPLSIGIVGPLAAGFFRTLRVDKAFIGAAGFDAMGGVNEPGIDDAATKRAMLEAARQSYLMVGSEKYGNVHLMATSKLSEYTCVITDDNFPQDKRGELEAACGQVIYA